jgi:type I restriction enzyme, S subunit
VTLLNDNLPPGWRWESLERVAVEGAPILYGILQPGPDLPGGVPYVRPTEISEDVIDLPSIRHTTPAIAAKYKRSVLKPDDIILSIVGTIGKVAIVPPDLDGGNITQSSVRIRVRPEVTSSRFIAWALRSPVLTRQYDQHRLGTAVPRLNVAHVRALRVPIPPGNQQLRIVAEIEKQFTRLEAGVAALRRVQANLKRYRAAVLKAACEGRLVPTEAELQKSEVTGQKEFENGEQLLKRILVERRRIHERGQESGTRRKKYKDPTPPTISTDEPLPPGWTWASWDQIGVPQNGRPFQSADYQPTGFKLLRPGNLHVSGKVIWNEDNTRCMPSQRADENPDLIVRGGELVMNLTAQSLKDEFLGRVCLTHEGEECLLNQRLARLTPIIVSPKFVLYLLKAWRFRRFVDGLNSGSLIQHMFTSQLAEFTFSLPPLAEQTRIVAEVERRLSVVEELESVVSANLQRTIRLRKSILQKAFTGQLVSEQSATIKKANG